MAKCIGLSRLGTAPDTYLYSLARNNSSFATIGSDDTLRLFDISMQNAISIPAAHSGISCLTANSTDFVTAGRDGIIRFWDQRAKRNANIELREPTSAGFSALACHGEFLVAAGTESVKEGLGDVSVLLYDTRNPGSLVRNYGDSHTDTITQLAFHPMETNLLLSGSTDGLVSVFDANVAEEDDALVQVLNPRAAVHCAGFLSATEVYVLTTDEQLSVHPLGEDAAASAVDFGDVRETLSCMYVVDVIAGGGGDAVMAYGHNIEEKLGLVELNVTGGWAFGAKIDLPGAHGEEVVRDLMLLRQEGRAITCGEDGQVKVWDLSAVVGQAGTRMEVD